MQLDLGHIASRVVDTLSQNHGFRLSDNWQPLFDIAANAKTFEQWYTLLYCIEVSAVPFPGMIPTCFHLYVDGSFFRGSNRAGWSFVVVAEVLGDKFVLQGYAASAVYEEDMAYFGVVP